MTINRYWTKKEKDALRKLYRHYRMGDIVAADLEKVFNRPWGAIRNMACKMRLTSEELEIMNEKEYQKICKVLDI